MQFFKEKIPALLHKSRRTLALSKAPECDVILFFILHGTTLSHARHDTSVCARQRKEKSGRPAWSVPWNEFQASHGSGAWKSHTFFVPWGLFDVFLQSQQFRFYQWLPSLFIHCILWIFFLWMGKKMTFNNLRETNESHYLEFFWDSRYIWWFLLLHHICWFYSYPSYLMVFQSHQRGRDWKMKVIFGSRTLFHVLGLINKVTSRSQFISTQLNILFNKAKDSRGKRFSMVTSASG